MSNSRTNASRRLWLWFIFFRMGNFTSTTGASSTACLQYVQVCTWFQICCFHLTCLRMQELCDVPTTWLQIKQFECWVITNHGKYTIKNAESWSLLSLPSSSLEALHVQSIFVVCWCLIDSYFVPDLSGSGVTELCGDIFQDHLSLLQNGQKRVQWNWRNLQSYRTGRAQWREENARSLSSDDWSQNGERLVMYLGS